MAVKKRMVSDGEVCKASFYFPADVDAASVALVGEFNQWDKNATPMERLKDGRWKAVLNLATGREFQYRYLIDGHEWVNDDEADRYETHPFGGENSVVST